MKNAIWNLRLAFFVTLFLSLSVKTVFSQVSYGGEPLFYTSALRSAPANRFIEMPAFDLQSLLEEDSLNAANMRGAFRFAHKFHVDIEKGRDGLNLILPDGTKVWQVGIRSVDAYSLNVLFSEYELPEGGQLFIYNSSHSHVIGAFTHRNNSEDKILPIRPVSGDEIIIEYIEPADAPFEARLRITEVNHAYRDLLKAGPSIDQNAFHCMEDVLCADAGYENNRSVALIIINGTTGCTATLVNNTNEDGEPYLITATHCLNPNIASGATVDYYQRAGTIISFFNYDRPVCDLNMKGIEEMSIAGAELVSLYKKRDITLLKLKETPPEYYQPYYAGWNVDRYAINDKTPFTNIHHPYLSVKKRGMYEGDLVLSSYPFTDYFQSLAFFRVSSWTVGSTFGGSSGSPLFDREDLLVGTLTGGNSTCDNNDSDYFTAFFQAWDITPDEGKKLKDALDPFDTGNTQCDGYNPYSENPMYRIGNSDYNGKDKLVISFVNEDSTDEDGYIFGNNSLNTLEFAEEFNVKEKVELIGAYLISYTTGLTSGEKIMIKVYDKSLEDKNLLAEKRFYPVQPVYSSRSFGETVKTSSDPNQTFVKFDTPVSVSNKFYISFEVEYPSSNYKKFGIYNAILADKSANYAWLRDEANGWFPATAHPLKPMHTSLAIEAYVRGADSLTFIPENPVKEINNLVYDPILKQLIVKSENSGEKGKIQIYSLTGQLIGNFPYETNVPVSVPYTFSGQIGIVRVNSTAFTQVVKLIF